MDNSDMLTTKEKIFHTSVRLFARKGYPGTALQEIAEEVGIRKSSIFNHYKCKEDILNEIYLRFMEILIDTTPSKEMIRDSLDRNPSPSDFWKERIRIYFNNSVISETGRIWTVILMEQFRDEKAGALIIEENKRQVEHASIILKMMTKRRLIKKTNTVMLAVSLMYALRALHYEFVIRHTFGMDTATCLQKAMDHIDYFFLKQKKSKK
jgi:AcrR family transcriptional regulator